MTAPADELHPATRHPQDTEVIVFDSFPEVPADIGTPPVVTQPVAPTPHPDVLPATGLESVLVVVAVGLCAVGVVLRRLADWSVR